MNDLIFAFRVAKFVKSNAIVFCRDGMTLGVGAGQMSRVDSTRIAAIKAKNAGLSLRGSVAASDAFFPFRDGLDVVAEAGAKAVIQPGGSVRDDGSDRGGRRARDGHGVHRDAALPALTRHPSIRAELRGDGSRAPMNSSSSAPAAASTRWPGACAQSPRVSPRVLWRRATPAPRAKTGSSTSTITAIPELVKFAKDEGIHPTVVGPEGPLAAGVVDAFRAAGLRIFGPAQGRRAARGLEGFRQALHGAPRAFPRRTTTRSPMRAAAHAYVDEHGAPIVIKADGLAAGKGVVVAMNAGRGARRHRHDARRQQAGRCGPPRRDRGIHGRRGGELHRHGRRQERAAARLQPGPQAHLRRRPGPEHRRHGRLFARARGHARGARARDARDHHARR